jgi:hypothetical protein
MPVVYSTVSRAEGTFPSANYKVHQNFQSSDGAERDATWVAKRSSPSRLPARKPSSIASGAWGMDSPRLRA